MVTLWRGSSGPMGGDRCTRGRNLNLHYLTNFAYPRMTPRANNSLPFVKLELCLSTDSPLRCCLHPLQNILGEILEGNFVSRLCNLRFGLRSSF
ncbi:hypothetical protein TorRG33x02_244110 [Trema orientale]|uniref:Uncharacterized protein n=1 Tax=Trema orientale TaxID=63057 RepID=A0A2P5DRW8_TREOI|nr:hypothetical protein TorRG33x02_244110 [Trema orientale]